MLTNDSLNQIDQQLHRVSFREIKTLLAILHTFSLARVDLVKARFLQDGLYYSEIVQFLKMLGIVRINAKGMVSRGNIGHTDDEIKTTVIHRLLRSNTPYRVHVNEFLAHFTKREGRFEARMDSEMRREFGGIRNVLLDLEYLDRDSDGVCLWIAFNYLPVFLETRASSCKTPMELQRDLRDREELGRNAEREVLMFELNRLRLYPEVARRIKHVAADNISAGYDIASFSKMGSGAGFSDRLT